MGMNGSTFTRRGLGRRGTKRIGSFADINITPLTDVVLVLLIIFMITAQFINSDDRGMNLNLPSATHVEDLDSLGGIRLAITRDGQYSVNGFPIEATALSAELQRVALAPTQLVIIEMDRDSTGQSLVTAMDAALAAGLPNTCLATAEPDGTELVPLPAPGAAAPGTTLPAPGTAATTPATTP